jgi:hypothetical protein
MQAEGRQVHVLNGDGRFKAGQLQSQLPGMRELDARRAARGVKATLPLVADRLDHHSTVARCATRTLVAGLF